MTEKVTAEHWAKALFGGGPSKAEAMLTDGQREQVQKEIKLMEERMKNVGIDPTTDALTEAIHKQVHAEPVEPASYEAPQYSEHVFEVPDEATKAFMRELNRQRRPERQSAHGFLEEASSAMKQRAALRDAEDGERTAAQIAKVFNAITGNDLSEADAWMFLIVLKIVRSRNGKYNRDDYVDLAAYAGLLGECESVTR